MLADNTIYETLDDWWDPTGSVAGLHAMNPARAGYFLSVLRHRIGPSLEGIRLLDIGCGGGILTENLLGAGLSVVGVDAAAGALRCALSHARAGGLEARYVCARGERLPFADGAFAAVASSDYLEHVDDLGDAIRECARVLAPGGLFLYDTINRSLISLLIHVGLLQKWRKIVPPRTHDWRQFVQPRELRSALRAAGLEPIETRGLAPVDPIRFTLRLFIHRRGRDRMSLFRIGSLKVGSYVGYAVKPSAR